MPVSEKHAEINLLFEFGERTDLEKAATQIEDRLGALEAVDDVEAMPTDMRITGAEIAAAIAVTAVVARSGRDAVADVRKLVAEIKGLLADLRDLKNVFLDIGKKRVPFDKLDEKELAAALKPE
jgi:hypothetical protein